MLLLNAVVLSVIVMLALSLARVHVVISLFVASIVAGLVAGMGISGTMVAFQTDVYKRQPQCSSNGHEHPRDRPGQKTTNPVTTAEQGNDNHHRRNKGWSRPQPRHAPQSLGNRMPDPFDKVMAVSYTHLDVYKRQVQSWPHPQESAYLPRL